MPSQQSTPKPLSFSSLLALGINGTVGVGIFYAPMEVMALVSGAAGALVYPVAALGLLPVAVVFGRLGRRFAENGGAYVWAREAFGPLTGFGMGWLAYLSALFSAAAVQSGLGSQLALLLKVPAPVASLLCLSVCTIVASLGLRLSALAFRVLTLLKLLPLLFLLLIGIALLRFDLAPGALANSLSVGRATLLVVFALQGFEVVPVLAGEAQQAKDVRRATLLSLVSCAALYGLLRAICVQALSGEASDNALADAAGRLAGENARQLLLTGQLLCGVGIAFGQIVTTPHYLAALGNEQGLGNWLGRTRANGVPLRALLFTSGAIALFVTRRELSSLFALSSIAVLAQYGMAALSLLVMSRGGRRASAESYDAFWALLAVAAAVVLGWSATLSELLLTLEVEAVGIALFVVLSRRSAHNKA